MYIYVVFQEKEKYYKDGPNSLIKARLEAASGERCLIAPYEEFDMNAVKELKPRAIAMSGFAGHFQDRKIKGFYGINDVFHQTDIPIIGFCGSHQLMGFCFNRDILKLEELRDQPMGKIGATEHFPRVPKGVQGIDISAYRVAQGYFPIRRVKNDPLFKGLPSTMIMRCSHYCEVKKLPEGFERLAESDHCRIEAMKHKSRILYGTQFHPESFDEPFFHGRKLLENFAKIVDAFWSKKESERSGELTAKKFLHN